MDNVGYISLTRQRGLASALDVIANNLANMSTTGYRAERLVFAEHVKAVESGLGSLSMAEASPRYLDSAQSVMTRTDGVLDLAIEGDGYFLIESPQGQRLTRSGAFARDAEGALVTLEGLRVLDAGGAPIEIPAEANALEISPDGVISADGRVVGQIGLVTVEDPAALRHDGGARLEAQAPTVGAPDAKIAQGFLERSNVDPISEITRMISVQRSYELGQSLMTREDERIRQAVRLMGEVV